jgi:hypothetical protein
MWPVVPLGQGAGTVDDRLRVRTGTASWALEPAACAGMAPARLQVADDRLADALLIESKHARKDNRAVCGIKRNIA